MTTEINLFETASRQKLRFKANNGQVSVEDLWDLPLTQLDAMAKELRRQTRDTEESFIENVKIDKTLETRFEIVKHVIRVRMEERQAKQDAKDRDARRKVLLEQIENRQQAELASKPLAELQAELAALDAADK